MRKKQWHKGEGGFFAHLIFVFDRLNVVSDHLQGGSAHLKVLSAHPGTVSAHSPGDGQFILSRKTNPAKLATQSQQKT